MKYQVLFLCIFLLGVHVFADEPIEKPDYVIDDKRIFLDASTFYENMDYGDALKALDKARALRHQKVDWEIYTLKNSLKSPEVKVFGDDLYSISKIFREREDYEALGILDRYKKYYTFEHFNRSMKRLLEFIKNRADYPEADYFSGKIYQLEGEYDVAEKLYLKAYSRADILDVPDEKYDILYALSDISFVKKDFKHYEEYLVLIVSFDPNYKNASFINSIKRTIRSKKGNSVEKFFKMYRADNYRLLNAYFALSEYYQKRGELDRALSVASLGCLTGFTKVYNVVKKRSPEFEYKNLASLLQEASFYYDIVDWGKENNVWKGFNDFAEYVLDSGNAYFANNLYAVLKDNSPEEYWRREAAVMLDKISASPTAG